MAKQTPPLGGEFLRPVTLICIMGAHNWSITTSASNVKVILIWLVPQATNASFSQPCSSEIRSTSAGNSTRLKLSRTGSLLSLGTNSSHFFDKVSENLLRLLIISEVKSKETLNTRRKKYKTVLLTCNTFNLSS